jgi:hypothetical protein
MCYVTSLEDEDLALAILAVLQVEHQDGVAPLRGSVFQAETATRFHGTLLVRGTGRRFPQAGDFV